MKILFFAESLGSGGKERRIVELIKGLSVNNSIEIELVLTKKEIRYEEIFQTKTKIHYLVRRGIKKDPRLFFQFYTIAKKFRPDLIHVWGNLVAIYAIPAKVILKIPMINSQITNANRKSKSKILNTNLTFPFSDKILSNSYAGLLAYKAPEKKSAVIYNGFSFGRIENLPNKYTIREELKIKSDLVVGMVGDYTGNKDYTTYIKAAIEVLKERNDVSFICAGDGDFTKFRDMVINHYKRKNYFFGIPEEY